MTFVEDSAAGEFAFSSQKTTEADLDFSLDKSPADAFDFSEQAAGTGEFDIPAENSTDSEENEVRIDSDGAIADPFSFEEPTESSGTKDFSFTSDAEEFSFGDTSPEGAFSMEEASTAEAEVMPALDGGETIWNAGEGPNDDFIFTEEDQEKSGADFDFSNMTFGEDSTATADTAPLLSEAPTAVQAPTVIVPPQQREERAATAAEDEPFLAPPIVRSGKGPISGILAFVLVLLVLLCAAAGYFYLQGGLPEIAPMIARFTGETPPPTVAGQIRVADLNGFFVDNTEAGQLFVIQGRAVNEFSEARSAIAVKGVLYNKEGKPLLQQTVYSGNMLSEEALSSLPFGKIEESMNNQFGDSLSNLNIAPGKSIPFTIVFRNLPVGLAEFTAEVTDSKPGAG